VTRIRTALNFVPALLLATPVFAADLLPKQLSGPASEFAMMAPADPAASKLTSKSALLPIELNQLAKGVATWRGTLPLEGNDTRMLVLGENGASLNFALQAPNSRSSTPASALAQNSGRTQYGLGESTYAADYYDLAGVQAGNWSATVEAPGDKGTRGFILLEGSGPQRLESAQTAYNQTVGQTITLTARLTALAADGSIAADRAGRMQQALIKLTHPDGQHSSVGMFDDGRHGDGAAADGLYAGSFVANKAGAWNAQVVADGIAPEGHGFVRTAEHLIQVVASDVALSAATASASSKDGTRLDLRIPVSATATDRHYRAYAEVWGTNQSGALVPIAWVSGMSPVAAGALSLGLDSRWISAANAKAPFELRNVRIEDPDYFITLAASARRSLSMPTLSTASKRAFTGIDEAMLMGPRPASLTKSLAKGVGTKLLLVHGYCSGNVWNAGNFSNSAVFQDLNQNRTHDQFAQRIKTFGNTWNSYGIVAHSQGGAAATHLYTFYWSGLDLATGSRLIQSVGTPYQGTSLAGNLAAIGSIFGAGCGTNANLTYSGAASWLATIPSWARAKVNYYTTSFTDRSWVYDYCHLASDLVLSDPDDGTTERAYGQMSGAINQGHKTGWCHTSNMRDPAQTTDASRNSTMSAQAAR
jgi:hypothetical protein